MDCLFSRIKVKDRNRDQGIRKLETKQVEAQGLLSRAGKDLERANERGAMVVNWAGGT